MSLFNQGCTCDHCSQTLRQSYNDAKKKWDEGKREIVIKTRHYKCSDGCCDEYQNDIFVNGFNLNCDAESVDDVIINLMLFLQIDNVGVNFDYGD